MLVDDFKSGRRAYIREVLAAENFVAIEGRGAYYVGLKTYEGGSADVIFYHFKFKTCTKRGNYYLYGSFTKDISRFNHLYMASINHKEMLKDCLKTHIALVNFYWHRRGDHDHSKLLP